MTLAELIRILEKQPLNKVVYSGFGKGRSYRGDYAEVAFEPKKNVDVHYMLLQAKMSLGSTYMGYKGGKFKVTEDTVVNIAGFGQCSGEEDMLTVDRLNNMLELE